jgi:hypothetical protein
MAKLSELLRRWPDLPNEAVVNTKVVAALTGLAERTIRYDPRLKRVYLTADRYGYRVDNVKEILIGETWRKLGDVAQGVVESCGADIRDTQIRLQRELNRQREKGRGQ